MKKLALETLCVESFETEGMDAQTRGTVLGNDAELLLGTAPWQGCTRTCPPDRYAQA